MTDTPTPRPPLVEDDRPIHPHLRLDGPYTPEQVLVANATGRPLNPDTGAPMPTPTARQLALVDELLTAQGHSTDPDNVVRRLLVDAVVREHGRTLRGCITELRDAADHATREARYYADAAVSGAGVGADHLARATRIAQTAADLRAAGSTLRGDR